MKSRRVLSAALVGAPLDAALLGQTLFGGDVYTQGVDLLFEDGPLQGFVGITDGYGSVNSGFRTTPGALVPKGYQRAFA